MNRSEAVAKCVVEDVLDEVTARYRHDQHALPDFDLLLGASAFGVLEVVMATSPAHKEIHAILRDERRGGPFVPVSQCQRDWLVRLGAGARVNDVRSQIDSCLRAVEDEGRTSVSVWTDWHDSPAARRLADLGVETAHVTRWRPPGKIALLGPGVDTLVEVEHVTRVVSNVALLADNRKKLGKFMDLERHLFVLVDLYCYDAWAPLVDGVPDESCVALPLEVSHAWVAAARASEVVVWRAEANGPWRRLGVLQMAEDRLLSVAGGDFSGRK